MDPMMFIQPIIGSLLGGLFGGGSQAQAVTHPKGQAAQNYQQWQDPESTGYQFASPVQPSMAPMYGQQQDPMGMISPYGYRGW